MLILIKENLYKYINKLTCNNIKCIISNRNTGFIKNLYNKYKNFELEIYCNINNDKKREEVLIYNY
jgi:hypothetical protein